MINKWIILLTDVTWNPHPPTPSPAGEGEQNPYCFLVPLSRRRGARGEGFTDFHVTPVNKTNQLDIYMQEVITLSLAADVKDSIEARSKIESISPKRTARTCSS